MESRRVQRVSEALREELAELVGYELEDPRLVGATVTACHLSPDGRHARVVVWVLGSAEERKGAMVALEHAKSHLRAQVASRLRLFRPPELHFEEDDAAGGESRVDQLLKRIHKNAARHAAQPAGPEPAKSSGETSS
jgi:ribosome-binding factor A